MVHTFLTIMTLTAFVRIGSTPISKTWRHSEQAFEAHIYFKVTPTMQYSSNSILSLVENEFPSSLDKIKGTNTSIMVRCVGSK